MTEQTCKPAPRQLLLVTWEEDEGFDLPIGTHPSSTSRLPDVCPRRLSSTDTGFLSTPPPQP